MTNPCHDFRGTLESKLSGLASARDLCEFSWHEHVLVCVACRTLLQEEEALEIVLSTLPDPVLPARLAERVLARLRTAREHASRLEDLLEIAGDVTVPVELGAAMLDRLRASRSSTPDSVRERPAPRLRSVPAEPAPLDLDGLLELDHELDAPPGLARHVLAGLKAERVALRTAIHDTHTRRRNKPAVWAWPLAAGVLAALGWVLWARNSGARAKVAPAIAHVDENTPAEPLPGATLDDPDLDLLAALDVLEEWNTLMQGDLDVELSTFEPADEILLEYSTAEPASETRDVDGAPSKG